jgi:hypothetical protein
MGSDHFYLFTALASFNKSVQERLQQVQTPEEIVTIAAEKGYQITVLQLSLFSKRLRAPHWVWSNRSEEWRHGFFNSANAAVEQHLQLS